MKIGIYTRVSTEEQAVHGVSLIAQENALMEYAKNQNYKVVDVYSDEGLSATTLDRPGLQRLLEDVRQGRIDLILITKLDRLSRGVANYYKIADVLESNNCGWKTILEDYDSTTASGRLHINIMLSVAENEAAVTKERIKFVFQNKVEKGEVLSGNKIIGYDIVDKHYVINEKEAEIIRYVFEEYPKVLSFTNLAKEVSAKFGVDFRYFMIKRILERKLYTGVYTHHGVDYPNYAPVIIDPKTFNNMQELIKSNARCTKGSKGTGKIHILTKLVRCPFGRNLICASNNKKQGKNEYKYTYVRCDVSNCPFRRSGECETPVHCIKEGILEEKILDILADQIEDEYKLHVVKKENVKVNNEYNDKIKKLKRKISKLEDMYLDDMISKAKYMERYKEFQKELEFYSERVLKLKGETTFQNVDEDFIDFVNSSDFRKAYYKLDDNKRHAFWVNIIKCIDADFEGNFKLVYR